MTDDTDSSAEPDGTTAPPANTLGAKPSAKKKTAKKKATPKKKTVKKKKPAKKAASQKTASTTAKRSYPVLPLEDAIALAKTIRVKNNGHPWDTELAAKASLGVKKNNNKFFYLAASSRDYDLTVGSRDTEKVELSELGRRLVFAGSEQEKQQALVDAFFSVDVFKRVFDHYGGSNLPEKEFLTNTLQNDFGIDPSLHDEFADIFKANCEFLGIAEGLKPGITKRDTPEDDSGSDVRVIGQPKGKFDRTAFVVMPFSEKGENPRARGFFNEVLTTLITPAANAAGFAVETADQHGSDVIQSTIITQLLAKELVIADLSDHNPNVLFELGIRIARDLPLALIKAEGTERIFDVDNMMRVVSYSPNLWPTTVATDVPKLRDHFKAAWDNRDTVRTYMEILTGKRHVEPAGPNAV
ncbi:hypothetical protein LOC67_27015 [Stieleria sp. JC731]|uniref:hypothetical protein n=1 Tax=Stieleria sp. JC731 TaxID=2894195 RepID=UPI001E31AD49|nr:hypothetical protein [Stieleria sp. JC731]MCC9604221.1 hypothetical protein [Stieleria sp. JC731]